MRNVPTLLGREEVTLTVILNVVCGLKLMGQRRVENDQDEVDELRDKPELNVGLLEVPPLVHNDLLNDLVREETAVASLCLVPQIGDELSRTRAVEDPGKLNGLEIDRLAVLHLKVFGMLTEKVGAVLFVLEA